MQRRPPRSTRKHTPFPNTPLFRSQGRQPQNRDACAAMLAIRAEQGAAFPFRFPSQRRADEIAEAIHPMTPERWLLLARLHVMPADAFEKLAGVGVHGLPAAMGLMKLAKGGGGLQREETNALGQSRGEQQ